MTELSTHSKITITNVSRRGLLKGVAATGGLVLAAQLPGVQGALAGYPTGAERHAERRRQRSEGVRLDRQRRHRQHRRGPRRDGQRARRAPRCR